MGTNRRYPFLDRVSINGHFLNVLFWLIESSFDVSQ